ncbi:hypothetical protein GCM10018784_73790 [Streptomyces hydrogenans]|nr:hypothetical protein GCM10018784_73790 [Streptomyces hydrogenans]
MVVTAVAQHGVGPAAGAAALAPDWRDGLQEGNELRDVVAVAPGQGGRKWNARGIGDQVVLAAVSAPVNRASSSLGAPFNARM